jgi:hypothetical protein
MPYPPHARLDFVHFEQEGIVRSQETFRSVFFISVMLK